MVLAPALITGPPTGTAAVTFWHNHGKVLIPNYYFMQFESVTVYHWSSLQRKADCILCLLFKMITMLTGINPVHISVSLSGMLLTSHSCITSSFVFKPQYIYFFVKFWLTSTKVSTKIHQLLVFAQSV
jgi:hypothetical protein